MESLLAGTAKMNLAALPKQMGLVLYLYSNSAENFTQYLKLTFPAGIFLWVWALALTLSNT